MKIGSEFFSLGAFDPSPDHTLLAYSVDLAGYEDYEVRIKDLTTGAHLPDKITKVTRALEWGIDNKTLYYETTDEAHRPYKAWRHTIGQPRESDECLYTENDELFWIGAARTHSLICSH
jgi:oligopeptidase B